MSLSLADLERRRVAVGASEVGLLFGLPNFGNRTVGDLWYEKKYGLERQSKGNASTDLGTKLEPFILDTAEEELGTKIIDRQLWVRNGNVAATLDGRLESTGAVIDAKTSGIIGPHKLEDWGDDHTDSIPENYIVQLTCQMLVTGAELGYLAALIGGRGFAMFQVQPQSALMDAIQAKADEFIASLANDEPPPEVPQLDTLKRIRRQPNKVLPHSDLFESTYEQYLEVSDAAKATEKQKNELQARLLAMLGDAEAIECKGGLITYFQQKRREFFSPESTFRVMRFAKGK